jgi:16S rRNA (guanine966-N2)-methyltransferase
MSGGGGIRIIGGSRGGRRLRTPKAGAATRPTSDRLREAVMSALLSRGPPPDRVLDLYAGTGALGLEALSRGAGQAVLVERHAPTAALIRDNAAALGFAAAAEVVCADVLAWLRGAAGRFGWVFLDPPYADAGLGEALALVAARGLLSDGAIVVAEHDWKRPPPEAVPGLTLVDRRRYGQSGVSFYIEETP